MRKTGDNNRISMVIMVLLSVLTLFLGIVFVVKFVNLSKNTGKTHTEYMISDIEEETTDVDNGLICSRNPENSSLSGTILLRDEEVKSRITKASWGGSETVSFEIPEGEEGDLIVLEFTAQSRFRTPVPVEILFNGDQKVTVEINDKVNNYYIPFYIRQGGRIMSLRLVCENEYNGTLSLGNYCVIDYGKDRLISSLKTGRYLAEDFYTEKTEWTKDALKGNAIVSDGNYLYLLRYGDLVVYRNNRNDEHTGALTEENIKKSLTEVGRLTGFGQVFSVRLYSDRNLLLICSRECGAFFVNIKDPSNPVLYSHYETVSLCYGGDVYGNYAFLCNRYNGIEIIDISNLNRPEYLTTINLKEDMEYWNCVVNAGMLYTVAKGQNILEIYDVRDLGKIELLGRTLLDGEAEALEIKDNRLFIATAKNSTYKGSGMNGTLSIMTGSGNGLEVYELSDDGKPELAAREKMDGRTNQYPLDVWDLSVYGDYVYVSLMNGGLLVYQINSPDEEDIIKRVKAFHIVADKTSEGFAELNPADYIMPYPVTEESHSAVIHSAVLDGVVYAVSSSGIYQFSGPDEGAVTVTKDESVSIQGEPAEKCYTDADGYEIEIISPAEVVYDVSDLPDGNFALACGEEGIQIMDDNLNSISIMNTGHSVRDIYVRGNTVYAAETDSFGVYCYEQGIITEIGRVNDTSYNAALTSLTVSKNAKSALVQGGYGRYLLIDLTVPEQPVILKIQEEGLGGMYGRNICTGLSSGKYMGISGMLKTVWYEEGSVNGLADPLGIKTDESNGYAFLGDECIVMNEQGYMIYNPVTAKVTAEYIAKQDEDRSDLQDIWGGKCIVYENKLITVKSDKGEVTVFDITDRMNPKTVLNIDTDYAVGIPAVLGDSIIVPIHRDGIMRIKRK